jgi:hypothetical protein
VIPIDLFIGNTTSCKITSARSDIMSKSQEKRVNRIAQSKGFRLEKVGKGPHHGRFAIVNIVEGARIASDIPGAAFSFSLEEAEDWLAKRE